MPLFTYRYRDEGGVLREGQLQASDVQAARAALREMNVRIEELQEERISPHWQTTENVRPPVQETTQAGQNLRLVAFPAPGPFAMPQQPQKTSYHPLLTTLRIYAGWLLAWYVLIFIIGSYQWTRRLPLELPYLDDLFFSPLLLHLAFAAFLFLLLSALQRAWKGRFLSGVALTIIGTAVFFVFQENI